MKWMEENEDRVGPYAALYTSLPWNPLGPLVRSLSLVVLMSTLVVLLCLRPTLVPFRTISNAIESNGIPLGVVSVLVSSVS